MAGDSIIAQYRSWEVVVGMVVECMVSMTLLDVVDLAKGAVGVGIAIVVSSEDYRKEWYTYLMVIVIIA